MKFLSICKCSQGCVGIITGLVKADIVYRDGAKGTAYTGRQLAPSKFMQPWASRNPAMLLNGRSVAIWVIITLLWFLTAIFK